MIKTGFVIKVFRYLRGVVKFSAIVPDTERTINEIKNSILIYDIGCHEERIIGYVSPGDYFCLCKIIRKNGGRVKIVKKSGLLFFLRRYRKRKSLFAGAIFGILLTVFLTMFVWNVTVEGGTPEIREDIYSVLSDYGIYVGAFKRNIDVKDAKNRIAADFPELSFTAVNLTGTDICVEIKLSDNKPDIYKSGDTGNIVAAKDGKIAYYRVYNGYRVIEEGDYVFKGQLLVSGIKEDYFNRELYFNSSAKVFASTENELVIRIPKKSYSASPGAKIVKRYISVFGVTLPLHMHFLPVKYSDKDETAESLVLFGKKVPVVYKKAVITKMKYSDVVFTEEELKNKAEEIMKEQFSTSGKKLITYSYTVSQDSEEYVATVKYTLLEDIAKYVPLCIENTN